MSSLSLYYWFKDQGAAVGGALALVAGVTAFIAGERQARATRTAAHDQIRAIEDRALEVDRRERHNVISSLNAEVARIKMEVELRCSLIQSFAPRDFVNAPMRAPYKVVPREVLISPPNASNLLTPQTCDSIVALLASLDQLNVQLDIRTQLADFHFDDFQAALKKIGEGAGEATAQLSEELTHRNAEASTV